MSIQSEQNIHLKEIANTIRGLSMDAVQKANSGHPGMPMGMADIAAVLWSEFLKHNPANPEWFDRDRFVLSNGHGSMLLYSLLHLYGYNLSMAEIENFRQWGSKTPGHPEYRHTPGVETTTGPLGQGISNAVGMAIAEASLAGRFNKDDHQIVNHFTYVFAGDGDLEEGISHEASSLAGHQKLGKLIVLWDDNKITIDGTTDLSFSEDVLARYEAYGWHIKRIDGHNYDEIRTAISEARNEADRPSIIACQTTIGFGSPNKAGKSSAHGEPLGSEELKLTKKSLGLPDKEFFVSDSVRQYCKNSIVGAPEKEAEWVAKMSEYKSAYPVEANIFWQAVNGEWSSEALNIPDFEKGKAVATRSASGTVLNYLAPLVPGLFGGSADLSPSNKTFPKGETAFSPDNRKGRYLHYGVREHAMTAIMNGLSLHGGFIPYAGTFFVFTDYMRPAIRMAALMEIQTIYVLTHDSIGLGEDGPTHQPESHLASLRAIPNVSVIRPMDASETAEAWKVALQRKNGPTALVLTRQNLPEDDRPVLGYAPAEMLKKGAYILTEDEGYKGIIIATGSEVEIALEAKAILNKEGIGVRVVSMPSMDLFDAQEDEYRNEVLPKICRALVAVEAAVSLPWFKYVGRNGKVIGLDSFGASAPYKKLYEEFGITAQNVVAAVKEIM